MKYVPIKLEEASINFDIPTMKFDTSPNTSLSKNSNESKSWFILFYNISPSWRKVIFLLFILGLIRYFYIKLQEKKPKKVVASEPITPVSEQLKQGEK